MGLSEAELAEQSGSSVERVLELERLGILVRRGDDGQFTAKDTQLRLRDDDVPILVELLNVWAAADDDELARLARAYGQNIRRLVASDLEIASSSLFARLRRSGLTNEEMNDVARDLGFRVLALGER